jgi:hypothetical protein
MGFGAETDAMLPHITADVVADRIPRELANRFSSDLIKLSGLQPEDYKRIAREAEAKLPVHLQRPFRAEVHKRLQGAIEAKKGVRFLEECVMQILKQNCPAQVAEHDPVIFP